MKTMSIYWNNDSDELRLLPDVRTMTCGIDGMQVVGSDPAIAILAAAVRDMSEHFTCDGPTEVQAHDLTNALRVANDELGLEFADVAQLTEWLES